jgi:hypothetical protein
MDVDKELLKEVSALKELSVVKDVVQDAVKDVVKDVVEDVVEVSKKAEVVIDEIEELTKTVVRTVETIEVPKTFQCCLPFLSKFWETKKQE